ncbi:MAG TPA: TIGR00730 family Rossman fold protein [Candidatus Bathyarchaeia archaeon]|nr:TIGR00730 family Rossman fold protein [Candidatus Bathyarchaeia archaeon]
MVVKRNLQENQAQQAPNGQVAVGMEAEPGSDLEIPAGVSPPGRRLSSAEIVERHVGEIIETARKLVRDGATVGDVKLINAALKEMRYSFRVFSAYKHMRKVTTFGSARTPEDHPAYRQAHEFARRLADSGWMVITGAGPGIMRACQEGSGRDRSFGINIRLPFEQKPNEFIHRDAKLINFKYFFTRKLVFVKEADAIALFPGGFGTHDEGFESLTLLQTGKAKPMPVVFIDAPGGTYWKTWQSYVETHLLAEGLISPEDMRLFRVTDDLDEAVEEITSFYRRYHSSRYVGDRLVMRLSHPLDPAALAELNRDFSDLLSRGEIVQGQALEQEAGEPELVSLPRLIMHFDHRHFGRLRMLIDRINQIEVPSAATGP